MLRLIMIVAPRSRRCSFSIVYDMTVKPDFGDAASMLWAVVGAAVAAGSSTGATGLPSRSGPPPAPATPLALELDEERAAGDAVAFGDVHGLDRAVERRATRRSPSSSPRARRAAGAAATWSPARDLDVGSPCPGIGAVTVLSPARRRRGRCDSTSTSGGGAGGGAGRLSRQAPRHGGRGADGAGAPRAAGARSRNAVVASPARTTGWATSQRRNGQVRRHALDLASRRAPRASASSASARVGAVRDQLRDHRVVARGRPRRPPRRPRRPRTPRRQPERARCGRPAAGTSADPRRRAAPRPRGPNASYGSMPSGLAVGDPDLLARRGRGR